MSIAIVLPCFKRVKTLSELCNTLLRADYIGDRVDLIFSIDYSGCNDVRNFANSLVWPYGSKCIIAHKKNIGLRNNILFCGDLTSDYDAVIILEDDLEVTPSFYRYATQAAEFYKEDNRIGGISLFAYHLEEITVTEFHPYYEGFDGCFIQWASSWGQLWTRRQWEGFRSWYSEENDLSKVNMPAQVKRWTRSWKKYFIAYLVERKKYFLFPFYSHVYNGNKAGGIHTTKSLTEVITSSPLDFSKRNFHFARFEEIQHKYDAFFQHEPVILNWGDEQIECEFDLFGHKENPQKPYIITSRKCSNLPIINSFDAGMIPMEQNIITHKSGVVFHLIQSKYYSETKRIPASSYLPIRKRTTTVKQSLPVSIYQLIKGMKLKLMK